MNASFRMHFPHPLQVPCNEEIMTIDIARGAWELLLTSTLLEELLQLKGKTFSRVILPAVSHLELNVMIFTQECEGTYRGPLNGHYSVIAGENKFCCCFIDCLFYFFKIRA